MPSIEIAVLGLQRGLVPPPTGFDIAYEVGLASHRVPSRFQPDFDAIAGAMYHLGNPGQNAVPSGAFTAYELLSDECLNQEPIMFLEFGHSHAQSLRGLLPWLLESSPASRLLFTSDYQFGPEASAWFEPIALPEFWNLHDSRNLRMNALYTITRS
jgi:hypothetical protein